MFFMIWDAKVKVLKNKCKRQHFYIKIKGQKQLLYAYESSCGLNKRAFKNNSIFYKIFNHLRGLRQVF